MRSYRVFVYCILNILRWVARNLELIKALEIYALVKVITRGKIISYTKQTVNQLCLGSYSQPSGSDSSLEIGRTRWFILTENLASLSLILFTLTVFWRHIFFCLYTECLHGWEWRWIWGFICIYLYVYTHILYVSVCVCMIFFLKKKVAHENVLGCMRRENEGLYFNDSLTMEKKNLCKGC